MTLRFGKGQANGDPKRDDEILKALQPHPNLNYLCIHLYAGTKFPNWMTLPLLNLRYLMLWAYPNCKNLPPLGKLPCLETLEIVPMYSVDKVGDEFLGIIKEEDDLFIAFPKLKKLEFRHMPKWRKWEGSTTVTISVMPCLREVNIEGCDSLKALPDLLLMTSFQNLHTKNSKILEECCRLGRPIFEKTTQHTEYSRYVRMYMLTHLSLFNIFKHLFSCFLHVFSSLKRK